ncbi:hypothetical protein HPY31_27115 [Brevibacillus sp. HB1.3]|nr:hypothetical protein [Brevibacillus sp. HB1.3]
MNKPLRSHNCKREFFHAYKTDGRFPEVNTLEQTKRASSAIQLLQLLELEWNPVRLLALLSTVGAAIIGSPYLDYYAKKEDILIATLEMFANEEP